MSKDTSGPAFPCTEAHGLNSGVPGMSLRQWYAGLAMRGWAADGGVDVEAGARWAFKLADAMLAEGNK